MHKLDIVLTVILSAPLHATLNAVSMTLFTASSPILCLTCHSSIVDTPSTDLFIAWLMTPLPTPSDTHISASWTTPLYTPAYCPTKCPSDFFSRYSVDISIDCQFYDPSTIPSKATSTLLHLLLPPLLTLIQLLQQFSYFHNCFNTSINTPITNMDAYSPFGEVSLTTTHIASSYSHCNYYKYCTVWQPCFVQSLQS